MNAHGRSYRPLEALTELHRPLGRPARTPVDFPVALAPVRATALVPHTAAPTHGPSVPTTRRSVVCATHPWCGIILLPSWPTCALFQFSHLTDGSSRCLWVPFAPSFGCGQRCLAHCLAAAGFCDGRASGRPPSVLTAGGRQRQPHWKPSAPAPAAPAVPIGRHCQPHQPLLPPCPRKAGWPPPLQPAVL